MQDSPRYAVGIDIGTINVRCVVGHIDESTGSPTIVGVGSAKNSGMRKGSVVTLSGPAKAIDDAVGEAERMSGYQTEMATISLNGSHILSTKAEGMIAVASANHEVSISDLTRIEEVATLGKIPANREILEVIPHQYKLDGQDGIKEPVGMTGSRLELEAHVVSALTPNLVNLQKATELARIIPNSIITPGIASAKAVLTEQQIENGVILIDIGGTTTNLAIYEEGDLQYTAVIPVGGVNITNDLAIGLKVDPEIAELVKIKKASAISDNQPAGFSIEHKKEIYNFNTADVDEIVEARLEEIFETINQHIKRAGKFGKLPSGAVITGGTANLSSLAEFAKNSLSMAAKIGKPSSYNSVSNGLDKPEFASVIGLMLADLESNNRLVVNKKHTKKLANKSNGLLSSIMNRFRM